MEFDDKVYDKICDLCEKGDSLCEDERYSDAIKYYFEALDLIPSPKIDWEAGTWVYTAIGDTYFMCSKFEQALEFFNYALKCPDGVVNPFVNLRIGQCFYEVNNMIQAKEFLQRAYMLDGESIFEYEDQKYIKCIEE